MPLEQSNSGVLSKFTNFLISKNESSDNLPSLTELSKELDMSVPSLREQLAVARALKLVDVKPRLGIRKLPYKFSPAIRLSLAYGLANNISLFNSYADLRRHLEEAYWYEAVAKLTTVDLDSLVHLIEKAITKLNSNPIQIPHNEHREMHLSIYKRLNNIFVLDLLEVYWDAYESVGLNVYADLTYLQEVWDYHRRMVMSIKDGDSENGFNLLLKHTDLLYHRPNVSNERNLQIPE